MLVNEERLATIERNVVRLEERMNTQKAEYRTEIARLAEDLAKREARIIWTIIAVGGLITAILGTLITQN